MNTASPDTTHDPTQLFTESEVAARLKTTVASVRWMRRTGRLSFIKIAGNRKVRFAWSQVLEDLRATEVRASANGGAAARQLTPTATNGGSLARASTPLPVPAPGFVA
ncbi:MAG: helix-turn-helix domain-containing protein [Verrucomicrobia bacterium]|nr:helix-turn-helix domain-containing protein [Verrucomicrobiota bacterium]